MPGSYPYVSEHTAKYQRIAVCGISKGKKFIDDIRQTCELEVQVCESTFLVPGILCGHGGTEQRENCRIHPASAGRGYHGDQLSFKEYIDPFTGSKNPKA